MNILDKKDIKYVEDFIFEQTGVRFYLYAQEYKPHASFLTFYTFSKEGLSITYQVFYDGDELYSISYKDVVTNKFTKESLRICWDDFNRKNSLYLNDPMDYLERKEVYTVALKELDKLREEIVDYLENKISTDQNEFVPEDLGGVILSLLNGKLLPHTGCTSQVSCIGYGNYKINPEYKSLLLDTDTE